MRRALTLATCGALLALTGEAGAAETGFAERLRLHGGYTHLSRQALGDDVWAGAIPEISYFVFEPRQRLRLSYLFGYTLHSARPGEIANRLSFELSRELSARTLLLLSTRLSQSSVTQAFVTDPAGDTTFGAMPSARTQLLTGMVAETTSWEASPVVRVDQQVDARYVTTVDAPARFRNTLVNATGTAERTFTRDAVGVLVRATHAYARLDGPDSQLVATSLAPRWRRDIGRALTSSVAIGATLVMSPDSETRTLLRPFGQALLALDEGDATITLAYTAGPRSNLTTAQLLDAHQVTLRASVPLSIRHAVVLGASAGYLHGRRLDLRDDGAAPPSIDAVLADTDLTWSPTPGLQLFARYQFFQQKTGGDASTSAPAELMRNAVILGLQLSTRAEGLAVDTSLPQRVDRGDAQAAPAR